jgi:periplasmic divalent cation tolerance protein
MTSFYWWKGKICEGKEYLIFAKTTAKHYLDVEKRIRSVHPYEVPEIVGMPIARQHKAYKDWLLECLRD